MPTKLIRKQFLLSVNENKKLEKEAAKKGLSVSNLARTLFGLEPLQAGGGRKQKVDVGDKPKVRKRNEK